MTSVNEVKGFNLHKPHVLWKQNRVAVSRLSYLLTKSESNCRIMWSSLELIIRNM